MKALISPNEIVQETYQRVVQVVEDSLVFEVAEPLNWVDCPNNISQDNYAYDLANKNFIRITPEVDPTAESNKELALKLLAESEWLVAASLADPTISNPYLANQNEFITWRQAVQQCVINPEAGDYPFPPRPEENWQPSS